MLSSIHHVLPSLAALGVFGYWIIGAAAGLEALVLTGIFVPGTLIVDAGGMMVQHGLLDFFDLVWFVAIGSILGGEVSWWLGRLARRGLLDRWNVTEISAYRRAARLFERRGGFALVLGRFLGPVAGFVPFAAAVSGMERKRFRLWNILSGFPYALAHVSLGYGLGMGLTRLSPVMTRNTLFVVAFVLVAAILLWSLRRLDRAVPHLLAMLGGVLDEVARHPRIGSWGARHPRVAKWITRRLDRTRFSGLPLSLGALAFFYLLSLLIGLSLDFLQADPIVQTDARLAELMRLFWTPDLIRIFTWITALGDTRLVGALLVLALIWLGWLRRIDLIAGLVVALALDLISVVILKASFARPRSILGYFHESTGSFPSGHATLSVAFYGMLVFVLWRVTRLGAVSAGFIALLLAGLIGASRLFLVEHYLSDVLAGWMLGALCLLFGIAVAQWLARRGAHRMPPYPRWQIGVLGIVTLALLGFAGLRVRDYSKALNPPPASAALQTVTHSAPLPEISDHPLVAQTLEADDQFALSFGLWATDPAQITAALKPLGWTRAAPPTLASLAGSAFGTLHKKAHPGAALAPLFWHNTPSTLGFSQDSRGKARQVARLRMWQTRYVDSTGARLWLGVLSRDDGLFPSEGSSDTTLTDHLITALTSNGKAQSVRQISGSEHRHIPVLALR